MHIIECTLVSSEGRGNEPDWFPKRGRSVKSSNTKMGEWENGVSGWLALESGGWLELAVSSWNWECQVGQVGQVGSVYV